MMSQTRETLHLRAKLWQNSMESLLITSGSIDWCSRCFMTLNSFTNPCINVIQIVVSRIEQWKTRSRLFFKFDDWMDHPFTEWDDNSDFSRSSSHLWMTQLVVSHKKKKEIISIFLTLHDDRLLVWIWHFFTLDDQVRKRIDILSKRNHHLILLTASRTHDFFLFLLLSSQIVKKKEYETREPITFDFGSILFVDHLDWNVSSPLMFFWILFAHLLWYLDQFVVRIRTFKTSERKVFLALMREHSLSGCLIGFIKTKCGLEPSSSFFGLWLSIWYDEEKFSLSRKKPVSDSPTIWWFDDLTIHLFPLSHGWIRMTSFSVSLIVFRSR